LVTLKKTYLAAVIISREGHGRLQGTARGKKGPLPSPGKKYEDLTEAPSGMGELGRGIYLR